MLGAGRMLWGCSRSRPTAHLPEDNPTALDIGRQMPLPCSFSAPSQALLRAPGGLQSPRSASAPSPHFSFPSSVTYTLSNLFTTWYYSVMQ